MVDLNARDRSVLESMEDGRANPYLIRDETDLEKGDVNTALVRLGRGGYVEQVTRGLYELQPKGYRELGKIPPSEFERCISETEQALEEIEAAFERGDSDAARAALEQAQEAISDGDPDV